MKKLLIIPILAVSFLTVTNCSSDSREETPTEVQDFTNATYLKNTLIGQWDMQSFKTSQGWWMSLQPTEEGYYIFNTDNTFVRKPYGSKNNNSFNESGTYTVVPATTTTNAIIKIKITSGTTEDNRDIILHSYTDGIVEISYRYTYLGSTSYERFKKK